jgi:hypothetical protein
MKTLSTKIHYFHGSNEFDLELCDRPLWFTNSREMASKWGGVIYKLELVRSIEVFHYNSETALDKALGYRQSDYHDQTSKNKNMAQALLEAGYSGYMQGNYIGKGRHEYCIFEPRGKVRIVDVIDLIECDR